MRALGVSLATCFLLVQEALSSASAPSNSTNLVSSPSLLSTPSSANSLASATASFSSAAPSITSSAAVTSCTEACSTTAAATPSTTSPASNVPSASATAADLELLTTRRLDFIVAGAGDPSNITDWLSTLGPDGRWPDSEVDYTAGCDARRANWPAQTHWIRLVTMSAAWHGGLAGGEQWAQDAALLAAISSAMDFWFENDFQDASCLDSGGDAACPCGTPGFWNTNWFSNIILIPNLVAQSCLLTTSNLTDTQRSNCTHITTRTYATFAGPINGVGILTGANLLDVARIGIDDGLFSLNTSLVADAYDRIHGEVVIENAIKADGIRADGSFGQHGGVLYNGNYGKDYAKDVLLLEIVAGDTEFAAGPENQAAFATLLDGDQWMIYRNVLTNVSHWDFSVLGRFISFPVIDAQATGSVNINITEIQQLGEEWNSSTLLTVYDRLASHPKNANIGKLNGNRMFFANDYMVQRGPGYITTVKMYSNRTQNSECLNNQNPFAFHLSDGTVYTYMQGNEYEDIAAAWDWNLIPGTTVDYNATTLDCGDVQFSGLTSFVGGVSDGQVGIAAMNFTNPATRALSWQKAWFFLENDVQHVMIPSISSSSNASVFSVLDQKRHNGDVFVNGAPIGQNTNFSYPLSLWHDNVGYLFDPAVSPVQLSVEVGDKSGNWSDIGISAQGVETVDLFAAWIDHGSASPSAPFAYTAFPAVEQSKFVKKALETRLQTIRNDADVSAVYDQKHRVAMFVFWNPEGGSATFFPSPFEAAISVNSSANAALIYSIDSNNITVADPSQTVETLELTFTAGWYGKTPSCWGSDLWSQVQIDLPSGGLAGSSVSQTI